jgi:hypothetical protein
MARRLIRSAARTAGRTALIAGTATAVSGRVAHRQAEKFAPAAAAPAVAPIVPSHAGGDDMVGRLQVLSELRASGALSEKEFSAAKAKVLKG